MYERDGDCGKSDAAFVMESLRKERQKINWNPQREPTGGP